MVNSAREKAQRAGLHRKTAKVLAANGALRFTENLGDWDFADLPRGGRLLVTGARTRAGQLAATKKVAESRSRGWAALITADWGAYRNDKVSVRINLDDFARLIGLLAHYQRRAAGDAGVGCSWVSNCAYRGER